MNKKSISQHISVGLIFVCLATGAALAQTPAFTYQGKLTDLGSPASGSFQMQFKLYDAVSGGVQVGSTISDVAVGATQGVFTVTLDFGSNAFSGANRWIEIAVRHNSGESYSTLSPREQIASSPYAVRTLSAASADVALDSNQLGGVAANQYVVTGDARLSDARDPLPNSPYYIQNTTTQQPASNLNISGDGTVGSLNANGAVSLGGIAPPATASAGQGRIYFDTASNKVKVSENSGAFVNLVGASGVSGSGTTNSIPFWSAGTTLGNSQITQSAAGVQLPNTVQLAVGQGNLQMSFGSPNGETGISLAGASGRADLRFDGTILSLLNGPAGTPPSNGIAIGPSGGATITGTNGDGAVVTARRFGGDPYVIIDATTVSQNSVLAYRKNNFNRWLMFADNSPESGGNAGSNFRLDAYSNTGGISTHLFVNRATGYVGVGTLTPVAKLHAETSQANTAAVYGNATGNGGVGVYGQSANGAAVHAEGNAVQARDKGGFVKAMIFVDPFLPAAQYIVRCYNGITNSSTGNCGFSVVREDVGDYAISFGFAVNDRFFSVTQNTPTIVSSLEPKLGNVNAVQISMYDALASSVADSKFYIIVY